MTTNKPEIVAWFKPASDATLNSVDVVITDRSMKDRPEISTVGFTEPLVRLSDYEALQAECEKLRALLLQSAPIIHAHAGASHMLEGFKPKRNKWDALVEQIDAAHRKQGGRS